MSPHISLLSTCTLYFICHLKLRDVFLISSVQSELKGLNQTFKSLKICLTHMQLTYCSLWSVLGPVSVTVGIDGGKDVLLVQFTIGFATLLWWLLVPSDDESSSWQKIKSKIISVYYILLGNEVYLSLTKTLKKLNTEK